MPGQHAEPTTGVDEFVGVLHGFGHRIDQGQAVVGDHAGQPAQGRTADDVAVKLGPPVLLVGEQQRSKARAAQEIQVTDIEDQWCLEPREAANYLGDEVGVARVDFALDAQDGGQAARVNIHLRTGAVDYVAAAWFAASEPVVS